MHARQLSGVSGVAVGGIVVIARRRIAAPLGIVRRKLHTAVAVPAFGHTIYAGLGVAGGVVYADFRHAAIERRHFTHRFNFFIASGGIGLVETKLFARRFFKIFVEKRVLVEHLLNLLAQLQGRQLQQSDGLLQLGRERQMLRDAE